MTDLRVLMRETVDRHDVDTAVLTARAYRDGGTLRRRRRLGSSTLVTVLVGALTLLLLGLGTGGDSGLVATLGPHSGASAAPITPLTVAEALVQAVATTLPGASTTFSGALNPPRSPDRVRASVSFVWEPPDSYSVVKVSRSGGRVSRGRLPGCASPVNSQVTTLPDGSSVRMVDVACGEVRAAADTLVASRVVQGTPITVVWPPAVGSDPASRRLWITRGQLLALMAAPPWRQVAPATP